MLIDGRHINTGQRKDNGPVPFRPENITQTLRYDESTKQFRIRLDDKANPEFWLSIVIDEKELEKAKEMEL